MNLHFINIGFEDEIPCIYDKMEKKILSFHDVLIRQCDLDCLQPRQWLNDVVLEFYCQFLSTYIPPESRDIVYVPPSTTYIILQGGLEIAKSVFESLSLKKFSRIFFCLNNNADPSLHGGTHWSSLVVDVQKRQCIHYDSSLGLNASVAEKFGRVLSEVFANPMRVGQAVDCPQQDNAYDCGLYCIIVATSYFPNHMACHDDTLPAFLLSYIPSAACHPRNPKTLQSPATNQLRKELIQLIRDLAQSNK